MFVRFKNTPKENFAAMQAFFARLKSFKEAESNGGDPVKLGQSDFWELSPPKQRHFYHWNKDELTSAQRKVSLPEARFDDERWSVADLLRRLKEGDFQLDELVEIDKGVVEFRVKDPGDAFDGLDDVMELCEAFALPLVGYQDGGSYIEVV